MSARSSAVISAVVSAATLLAGCYPKVGPAPGPVTPVALAAAQARDATLTAETVEQGRQVFLEHCDKCHGYAALEAVREAEWPSIVTRMSSRAGIKKPEEQKALLAFVLAARTK